jgi:hypothetical protein
MTRDRFILATAATFTASAFAAGRAKGTTMNTSRSLDSAIEQGGTASKLTVYHIDPYTTTRTAIRPEQVETFPGVEVHTTSDQQRIAAALRALRASAPAITTEQVEYRWKLVFENSAGTRVLEAYASSFHPYGRINDTPVAFGNEQILHWLREAYAPSERSTSPHP